MQSFGGGTATLALIRRAVVDDLKWITPVEFTSYWALVVMVPGINLLGLTILIGRQIGGAKGVAIALAGLLLPSVTITIVLTALYAKVQRSHLIVSALGGVIPATIGVGFVTGLQIARPVLASCVKRGALSLVVAFTIMIGSGVLEALAHWPVVAILITSGSLGALTQFAGIPQKGPGQ